MLDRLAEGSASVSELARPLQSMSVSADAESVATYEMSIDGRRVSVDKLATVLGEQA